MVTSISVIRYEHDVKFFYAEMIINRQLFILRIPPAVVVDDHMFPEDMARIGTKVSLKDLGTGSVARFLLCINTGKHRENDGEMRAVSVTSPLGVALLGTRTGEHIKWTLPNGHTRYLRISELARHATAVC